MSSLLTFFVLFFSFNSFSITSFSEERSSFFPSYKGKILFGYGSSKITPEIFGDLGSESQRVRKISLSCLSKIGLDKNVSVQSVSWSSGKNFNYKFSDPIEILMYPPSTLGKQSKTWAWETYVAPLGEGEKIDPSSEHLSRGGPFLDGFAYVGKKLKLKGGLPQRLFFDVVPKSDSLHKLLGVAKGVQLKCSSLNIHLICIEDDNPRSAHIVGPDRKSLFIQFLEGPTFGEWIEGYKIIVGLDSRTSNHCATFYMFSNDKVETLELPCLTETD